MSKRLRIVLPSVMGVLSLPLIFWDIHNARAIESMGMAWDTGAPIWPYQASDILLRLLNGPAYFIAVPLANILRLAAPSHHLLVFPAILIWWWFLGLRLDDGLVRTKPRQSRASLCGAGRFCSATFGACSGRFPRCSSMVARIRYRLQGCEHSIDDAISQPGPVVCRPYGSLRCRCKAACTAVTVATSPYHSQPRLLCV